MRMVSIASGSSGNCIYIGSDNTHVLVDAGISNKRIEMGLNDLGLNARELDGILITHEHSDHIKGLGVLARKYPSTSLTICRGWMRFCWRPTTMSKCWRQDRIRIT